MSYSMNALYRTIGLSKQAVAQYQERQEVFDQKMSGLVKQADALRAEHPGCGVEKMYSALSPDFIGRDRFVEAMMGMGYRLKKKRNYRRTTVAAKEYYPNLIKGLVVDGPGQVWQSDITYLPIGERHFYGVFIIDVYTKEIVGYQVSDHMRAVANVMALELALKEHGPPRIHHSDRGSQYTYKGYTERLEGLGCQLSMAESAQDNAYAERINRTLKEEYLDYWNPKDFKDLKRCVDKAVKQYNNNRPHNNIGKIPPKKYKNKVSLLNVEQRDKLIIFNDQLIV